MARLASKARAGYYPFPVELIPAVAARLDWRAWLTSPRGSTICHAGDPCAGEGVALLRLLQAGLGPALEGTDPLVTVALQGYELETVRARRARQLWTNTLAAPHQSAVTHADLFRVRIPPTLPAATPGLHLQWLNPPYDDDREYVRLEERFLRATTPLLIPGSGVLCFIIPSYALAASAGTLAREYEEVQVYRLPDPQYAVFRQVVVLARRRARPLTYDGLITPEADRLRTLAARPETVPVLPAAGSSTPPDLLLPVVPGGLPDLPIVACDLAPIQPYLHLWSVGNTVVAGDPAPGLPTGLQPFAPVGAYLTLADFCQGAHVTALPPLPTHTAQILASGMVNGQLVQPNDPTGALPPVILTGHFQRVAQTTDTNINSEGEVTSIKMEEKPKLRLDILALSNPPAFYTLKDGTQASGTLDLGAMNMPDFLAHYGEGLAAVIKAQFPALHDPSNPDHHLPLPALRRPLFNAQLHAVCALLKIAAIRGENPHLYGEAGVGKTAQLIQLVLALSAPFIRPVLAAIARQAGRPVRLPTVRNVLIAAPPHLLDNWTREIGKVLPGAQVRQITRIRDLHTPPPPRFNQNSLGAGLTFDILSREAAKLGHGWATHRPGAELGPGLNNTTHRARTGFPGTRRFTLSYGDQARAALFAAARYTPTLGSRDRVTQLLRTATGNLTLRLGTAGLGDLQAALACVPATTPPLRCPRCGMLIAEDAETLADSRGRCPHRPQIATNPVGRSLADLAVLLGPFAPGHELLRTLHPLRMLALDAEARPLTQWPALVSSTPTVGGPLARMLFGQPRPAPTTPVERLAALARRHAITAYQAELIQLHRQLLPQPQAVRDAVLATTLEAIQDHFEQWPATASARSRLAPFVRRLLSLWSLGPARTARVSALARLVAEIVPADRPPPPGGPTGLIGAILDTYRTGSTHHTAELQALLGGLVALIGAAPDAERARLIPATVPPLYAATAKSRRATGPGHQVRYACCLLLALLPDAEVRRTLTMQLRPSIPLEGTADDHPWAKLDRTLETLSRSTSALAALVDPAIRAALEQAYPPSTRWTGSGNTPFAEIDFDPNTGTLTLGKQIVGTPAVALLGIEQLVKAASFTQGPACGETLVQAIPNPGYRVALSRYILRHKALRHRYQLLALDEAHEANHAERAQSQAYYRLAMLPGVLTIPMTGTPMNGYASSIFDLWWHLNRRFREMFGRKERQRFVTVYGYRKLLQRMDDGKERPARQQIRGKQSDAIIAGDVVEVIGEAPGIAPTALLFTLPDSVPLHLAHLEQVLPPRERHLEAVAVNEAESPEGAAMLRNYQTEMRRLMQTITDSLRDKDLAGRLWGFLYHVGLGYPILCPADVGNELDDDDHPRYQFRYPKSCGYYAGQVLVDLPLVPARVRLPHETALLQLVRKELQEGRNCIVYLQHTGNPRLAERIMRLLAGVHPAIYLDVGKVSTGKRDEWITKRVLQPGIRVMLTNPEAVKTGLNNLTPHFQTAIWLEPTQRTDTYRQAGARIRRIGSHPTIPIRDYLISYAGTAQEAGVKLILQKVQTSELFDGFDLDAGLAAAGVQGDGVAMALGSATTSIGKALYDHLRENSGLLRAAAFTQAVVLEVARPTLEATAPARLQPAPPLPIIPIKKGDATQLSMF